MGAAKKKPSSLADNPPIELYGPEDGGWYSTRVHDWISLCPDLRDPDIRGYTILRSLIIEKYKNPVRKLTMADLCELIPSPTKGQPSSLTRVRGILSSLSAVGLVADPEGGPVKTSSRPAATLRPIRIRVNDLPPDGYRGWRNTEDKLAHIVAQRVEGAGRKSDPASEEAEGEAGAGRKSDPAGRKSDPEGQKSDPHTGEDLQEPGLPLVSTVGTASGGDAPSGRSPVYGRRPSDGSSAREAEGGSAASSNTQPTPTPHTPRQRPAKSSSKAKHTREQLDRVRAVRALYPPDLLHGWTSPDGSVSYEPLPDVPTLSQAILDALAGDVPAADRTVEQLGARIQQRWRDHGWADNFYAGAVTSLVGVAIDMVRPLKGSDRYGCANPRCDAGRDVDTGEPCVVCPERIAARKAARRQAAEPSAAPAAGAAAGAGRGVAVPGPREHRPFRECPCREPIPKDSEDTLCPACRRDADEAERDRQLREQLARQYGTPEQVAAYCGEPPF